MSTDRTPPIGGGANPTHPPPSKDLEGVVQGQHGLPGSNQGTTPIGAVTQTSHISAPGPGSGKPLHSHDGSVRARVLTGDAGGVVDHAPQHGVRPKVGTAGAHFSQHPVHGGVQVEDLGPNLEADAAHVDGAVLQYDDDIYDTDDDIEQVVNSLESQYKRSLSEVKVLFDSVMRFDTARYTAFSHILGSLKAAKEDFHTVGTIAAVGNHPQLFPLLEEVSSGIAEILDKLVPNYKLVLTCFKQHPRNSQDEKDILMSHFKLLESYQRAVCIIVRKLLTFDSDVMSVSSFATITNLDTEEYAAKRNSFVKFLAEDIEAVAKLTQLSLTEAISDDLFDERKANLSRRRLILEDEYRAELLKAWSDRRVQLQVAEHNQRISHAGDASSEAMIPCSRAVGATSVPHSNSINVENLSTSVQQVNSMDQMLDLTKNLVQMQLNSMNSNFSRSSEYSEYKEKALPGNRKDDFYANLPPPWNVQPEKEGRYQDEYNKISTILAGASKDGSLLRKFDGTEEEYFDWRSVVLHHIHERNVSIKDKYNSLCQSLKRGADTFIDGLLNEVDPSHGNYRNLIEQLEFHYGGERRAYTHALKKLKKLKELDIDDFNSLSEFYCAVGNFISFCELHRLAHCASPGQIASDIIKDVMSLEQLQDMFSFCKSHRITELNGSLYQLKAYLFELLSFAREAREVVGLQRLPSNHPGKHSNPAEGEGHLDYDSANIYYCDELTESDSDDDQFSVHTDSDFEIPDCLLCKDGKHFLGKCSKFLNLSLKDRMDIVTKESLCYNCLGSDHGARYCPSRGKCLNCRNRHHTSICPKNTKDGQDRNFIKKFVGKQKKAYATCSRGKVKTFR